jgi:hypothetical protein
MCAIYEALSWNFPATRDKRLLRGTDRTHILHRVTGCVWFPRGARIRSTKSRQATPKATSRTPVTLCEVETSNPYQLLFRCDADPPHLIPSREFLAGFIVAEESGGLCDRSELLL